MKLPVPTNYKFSKRSVYRTISFLLLFLSFIASHAQTSQWTWVSGDNTANQSGVYGTKGTAAATNKPGDRDSESGWKDASGNFWIFGGWDINSDNYNDLWKYNTSTGQWTWVSGDNTINQSGVYGTKGTAAATNKPGARRNQAAWVDASGNFWIFGGYGTDGAGNTGYLNDLWKYNTGTGQWTWMSGDNTRNNGGTYGTKGTAAAANKPGGRYRLAGWADASGNFWIIGGSGYDGSGNNGSLNDLWKYNPTTGQWTWVSGDNTRNSSGTYGTKGTAAATNEPGGRYGLSGVVDASGNFWIFGGNGYDGSGNNGVLNDLWKYNPTTGQWTWVSGDNTRNNNGSYGTQGTAATGNKPGGRYGLNMVLDASGNFWVFAGLGYPASGGTGVLNDLWKYDPSAGQWTWVSGDNTRNSNGTYGTKGTAAATNKPGGRFNAASWIDASGNLWSFAGYDNNGNNFNDLWKFNSLTVLPVRLITLQGNHRNSDNVLVFTTTGEDNTDRFNIERSAKGINYSVMGTVTAVGSGNNRYSFTDHDAANNSFYYRIQVIDKDGHTSYSPVITLNSDPDGKVTVYPNPATTGVYVKLNDNSLLNTTARLYTATGQLIASITITSSVQYINLQQYAKGLFTLRLNNGKAINVIKE
ncbi:hypothetical protein A3860_08390 [Niastella vici]|uniref:Secretion system C-terminal sorting domain-containing protein n=1 Tax=Niastella vici TaxID=1703345 RepID=A0A1V9FH28_9BACT|nr:kelch repeat-containing protein [Niastella vici]OQP57640.1 hypothetical protein A3860_08390 [Niastella vici]